MKFFKCPISAKKHPPYQHSKDQRYCSAKLPCGRCISGRIGCTQGAKKLYDFNCSNCRYRFVCFTMDYQEENNYKFLRNVGLPYGQFGSEGNCPTRKIKR